MINLLLIEDNAADAKLVEYYLKAAFARDFSLAHGNTLAKGLKLLSKSTFDLVIADMNLPDSNGLDTFTSVCSYAPGTPVIVLTGNTDESLGLEAVKIGAADFLNKNDLDGVIIKRSISYSLERYHLQKELIEYTKQLEDKEQQLEEAQRIAHIGSWEWDLASDNLTWSDELYRIHGMRPREISVSLLKSQQWILPTDMDRIKKQLKYNLVAAKREFENGKKEYVTSSVNYRILLPDGSERTLRGEGKIILNEDGKPVQMMGTVQDITALERVEKELRRINQRLEERVADRTKDLKATIKQLQDEMAHREKNESEIKRLSFVIGKTDNAILIADSAGIIQWVNEGFSRLSGYSLQDVAGTRGEIVRHGKRTGLYPSNEFFEKMLIEKQTVSYESHNYKKDGTEYWTLSTLTPIMNGKNEIESVVVIDSDITSRKRAEQEILNAKKLAEESSRAKELFLANMSHEIRTPMNAIMGIVQLMEDMKFDETQKHYLHSLKFAGENLLYIINDVLDISKIESGKMHIEKIEFDLIALIDDLISSMNYRAKEKNIVLSTDLQTTLLVNLVGDPVRLNQILTNLIGNAIKFTEGGRVKLSVRERKRDNGSSILCFEVEDNGIGIPKEKQELIFRAFEQAEMDTSRKYGGTGLGLYIVKRLVELQGGTVSLVSEPGNGSTFSFELAFDVAEKKSRSADQILEPGPLHNVTGEEVLLVEDNALNQMVAEKFLEGMGLSIDIAENGAVAVKMLKEKKYDLVLMDIQMPEMDGYEATRHIRSGTNGNKNIPILAMTAHALHDEEAKCRKAGMNDYISKPLKRSVLHSKIIELLHTYKKLTT